MDDEAPALALHAERAEQLRLEHALRLPPRHALGLRIPALREIPDALAAAAADDRHLAARAEHLEHQPHLPLPPPAVRLAPRAGVIGDLAREQRPAPLELSQHVAAVRRVFPQVRDVAAVERPVA